MSQKWLSRLPTESDLEKLRNEKEALDRIMKVIHEWMMNRESSSEIIMTWLLINEAYDNKWGEK